MVVGCVSLYPGVSMPGLKKAALPKQSSKGKSCFLLTLVLLCGKSVKFIGYEPKDAPLPKKSSKPPGRVGGWTDKQSVLQR